MSLPTINVDLEQVQKDFNQYFHEILLANTTSGYYFSNPPVIRFNEETDDKIFVYGFFRNTNAHNDGQYSIYFMYYDGCNCDSFMEEPQGRYQVVQLNRISLVDQWRVYQQCQQELNNNN